MEDVSTLYVGLVFALALAGRLNAIMPARTVATAPTAANVFVTRRAIPGMCTCIVIDPSCAMSLVLAEHL